jgi:hypothetical protein
LFNYGRRAISVAVSVLDDRLFLYHVRPTILINDDLVTRLALADNFLLPDDAIRARANGHTGTNGSDAHTDTDFFSESGRAQCSRGN